MEESKELVAQSQKDIDESRGFPQKATIVSDEISKDEADKIRNKDKGQKKNFKTTIFMSKGAKDVDIKNMKKGEMEIVTDSTNFDPIIDKMESKGLLNRAHGYSIKKNGDELFIDGKKQPQSVYDEYKSDLGYKKLRIKGDSKHIIINMETTASDQTEETK